MQDIRPNKPSDKGNQPEQPSEPLPSPKQLYTKKKPPFSGSKVPVASINVPDSPEKPAPKPNRILEGAVDKLKASALPKPTPPKPEVKQNRLTQVSPVPRPKTKPKQSMKLGSRERKLLAIMASLVVVVLLLAAYLFLPKAEVTLALQTAPLLLDETLTLRQTNATEAGVIPGTVFRREVSVEGASPTASTETVGEKATGNVRLVNKTVDEQPIKEQSRLVTEDGQLFYMQRHAIIPPNSSVTVPVEAAEAGSEGNIEPQELNFAALDESSQSLVYGVVDTAFTGGSGEVVSVVKESDIEDTREAAAAAAKTQVEQSIRAEVGADFTILEESWTAELSQFETDAELDSRQQTIPYTATAQVYVFGYKESALEETLREALEARLDDEYMLFPEPISYTKSVTNTNWEDGTADLKVRVTHTTIPTFSINTLQEKLAGRSEEEARDYLQSLPGVQAVELELSPFWALNIPNIEQRITINLVSDRQP